MSRSPKQIAYDDAARTALGGGIALAGRIASVTYGPRGGLVALERTDDSPLVTKSGFAAVRDVTLADPFARLGMELVKEAVTRVHYATGDGVATASLLTASLSAAAARLGAAGFAANRVSAGFNEAWSIAVDALEAMRRDVPGHAALAGLIARAGEDDLELATIIAEAVERVGPDGLVRISYNQSVTTVVDYAMGITFDRGVLSRDFLEEDGELRLERPLILFCEDPLEAAADVIPALEIARAEKRPLLVMAESVSKQAHATLIANRRGGVVQCAAIKGPGSGTYRHEMTADLAILAGGHVLGPRLGRTPSTARREDLGSVELAVITGLSTQLFEGAGDEAAVAARVRQLRDAHASEQATYDRGKIAQRLARLTSGVANIRVGAFTEAEWKERYRRAETMASAAQGAVAGGIVPGGGVALHRAGEAVRAVMATDPVARVFADALDAPFSRIVSGVGLAPGQVAEALAAAGAEAGFDARSRRVVPDAAAEALVDPLTVVIAALNSAVSTAEQVAKVGCAVTVAGRPQSSSRETL